MARGVVGLQTQFPRTLEGQLRKGEKSRGGVSEHGQKTWGSPYLGAAPPGNREFDAPEWFRGHLERPSVSPGGGSENPKQDGKIDPRYAKDPRTVWTDGSKSEGGVAAGSGRYLQFGGSEQMTTMSPGREKGDAGAR